MPFYTFKCRTCGDEQEELRKMDDFKEPLCPRCCYNPEAQGEYELMERIMPQVAKPNFKGSGFYETDYKRSKAKP